MPKFFEKNEENVFLDQSLRPTCWDNYIGQEHIKQNLKILIEAANKRKQVPDHLLFYGPPGLGKTTLAHLIAKETKRQIKITSGSVIEKVNDLASIITNLSPGDIFFIDEIHRLNKNVEEILYPAMEFGILDVIIGKGPSARTIQIDLPPFTLIAATTKIGLLSSPLRSRFSGGIFKLEFYSETEIKKILERSSEILKINTQEEALNEISLRSRFTPRIANYLLKRCRDYIQVKNENKLTKESVIETFNILKIDEKGLTISDYKLLKTVIEKFQGGPVGLNTLATVTSEEETTIEEVIEPYLIQIGFLERTPRGRIATKEAFEYFKYHYYNKKNLFD